LLQCVNESEKSKDQQKNLIHDNLLLEGAGIPNDNPEELIPLENKQKNLDSENQIKTLNAELKSICFFAVKNKRKRYFLPSQQNFFAGIHIPYCMMDSGCGSLLLPLDNKSLDFITNNFSSHSYLWKVGGTKGVGALDSKTLTIDNLTGKFTIKLMTDILSYSKKVTKLRFHVSYHMALQLLDKPQISSNEKNLANLKSHVNIIDEVNKILEKENSKGDVLKVERTHALIGQTFFGHKDVIQKRDIMCVLKPQVLKKSLTDKFFLMEKISRDIIKNNFQNAEFDDLEDQDHQNFDDIETYSGYEE